MLYLKVLSFSKIKDSILNLFAKSDKYLVIEILNDYAQITVLKVNPLKKTLWVKENWVEQLKEFSPSEILDKIKLLLGRVGKLRKYKIILSLDSCLTTTLYASLSLIRPNSREVIDEADIDNLISQAIWKFFDKHRFRVAQKMEVDDIDVILSDVHIRGIKIDGHKVINPIGFKAKSVEIFFSQTFIIRELLRGLRELIPKENIFLITEAGIAISHIFTKILDKNKFFVANLFPSHTAVFLASDHRLNHLDNFPWGENQLLQLLLRYFRLDWGTAQNVLQAYINSRASGNFLRRLENILIKELQIFANGLESVIGEENAEVYLNPFFSIPQLLLSNRFQGRFQKPVKLSLLSTNLITEKLGYTVQYKASAKVKNPLSLLAAFVEATLLPQNDKMSHLANRRVRWLVT